MYYSKFYDIQHIFRREILSDKIKNTDVIVSETEMNDWRNEIDQIDRYIQYNE